MLRLTVRDGVVTQVEDTGTEGRGVLQEGLDWVAILETTPANEPSALSAPSGEATPPAGESTPAEPGETPANEAGEEAGETTTGV